MSILAAGDPLYSKGIDATVVLIVIGKVVVIFALLLLSVMMYIWFLRKVIADMQNRIGPDRAGPFGSCCGPTRRMAPAAGSRTATATRRSSPGTC